MPNLFCCITPRSLRSRGQKRRFAASSSSTSSVSNDDGKSNIKGNREHHRDSNRSQARCRSHNAPIASLDHDDYSHSQRSPDRHYRPRVGQKKPTIRDRSFFGPKPIPDNDKDDLPRGRSPTVRPRNRFPISTDSSGPDSTMTAATTESASTATGAVTRKDIADAAGAAAVDEAALQNDESLRSRKSSGTVGTSWTAETAGMQSLKRIFANASALAGEEGSGANEARNKEVEQGLVDEHRALKSVRRVVRKVRSSVSRDSGRAVATAANAAATCTRVDGDGKMRNSNGLHDDVRRHQKPRDGEASWKRVGAQEGEIIDSEKLYDEDAIPVKTPTSTWGRAKETSLDIDNEDDREAFDSDEARGRPRTLSCALKRSLSPLPPSHKEMERKDVEGSYAVFRSTGEVLSRMLVSRASAAAATGESWMNSFSSSWSSSSLTPYAIRRSSGRSADDMGGCRSNQNIDPPREAPKRFIFEDADDDDGTKSQGGAHPADSSRVSAEPEPKDTTRPLLQMRISMPPPSLARVDTVIRTPPLPFTGGGHTTLLPYPLGLFRKTTAPVLLPKRMASTSEGVVGKCWRSSFSGASPMGCAETPIFDNVEFCSRPHQTDRTATKLDKAPNPSQVRHIGAAYHLQQQEQSADFDPEKEELRFGGVDGNTREFSRLGIGSRDVPVSSHKLSRSSSAQRLSKSQGPASKSLLLSTSLPQMKATSAYAQNDHNGPRRCSSPLRHDQWTNKPKKAILAKIGPRVARSTPVINPEPVEIVSIPAANLRKVDLDRLERRTYDTSFHSSMESLTNRELAASEERIRPRANTSQEPKSSWFKEDFEDVAREIRRTNPIRRSFSGYDGGLDSKNGSLRVPRNRARYSVVSEKSEGEAISAWDKALREHSKEDRRLSKTRLGSEAPSHASKRLSNQLSMEEEEKQTKHLKIPQGKTSRAERNSSENSIQAQLNAYRLPQRNGDVPTRRARSADHRGRSSNRSSSWARYPSHTREQRSPASAGEADDVYPRDFAQEQPAYGAKGSAKAGTPRKGTPIKMLLSDGRAMDQKGVKTTIGHNVTEKFRRLYGVGNIEFNRKFAPESHGHRSSISPGGLLNTLIPSQMSGQ